jgi:hypothetical protein
MVAKGEPANDTVTLYLPDQADNWMTDRDSGPVTVKAHGTLYGSSLPFAEQAAPPATAAKLGEANINITLPTSGREPVTVPAPAGFDLQGATHWTWVWEVRLADQPAPRRSFVRRGREGLVREGRRVRLRSDDAGHRLETARPIPGQWPSPGRHDHHFLG